MSTGQIKVATCQFGVCESVENNARHICSLMTQAKNDGADIIHFSECALSGYAGIDFETFDDYDWSLLKEKTLEIIDLAGKLKIWTVLGSSHPLTEPNMPHNSLYLIGPDGRIHDRYDKRFCTELDLSSYTPGDHFVHFDLNDVKCSLLICFDLRFPEIYRALYKDSIQCIFQSFYNARQKGPSVHSEIMRQTMQCRAATNYFWISMTNSTGYFSPYPSCFIQPDGRIAAQLKDHKEGLMINAVDTNEDFYDPSARFRTAAINGALSNATEKIDDPRSKDRTNL